MLKEEEVLVFWRAQRPFYAVLRRGVLYCYEVVREGKA